METEDALSDLCSSDSPTKLVVSTSNVFRDRALRYELYSGRMGNLRSDTEAMSCLSYTLAHRREEVLARHDNMLVLSSHACQQPCWRELAVCNDLERKDVETLFKVFPSSCNPELVQEALEACFRLDDSNYVNSLQIAPPVQEGARSTESFVKFWKELSSEVVNQKCLVRRIGVADIDKKTLTALIEDQHNALGAYYVRADEVKDNPTLALAQEQNLTVLVHDDPPILIKEEAVKELAPRLHPRWSARMIARSRKDYLQVFDKRWIFCLNAN